ncbi:Uncharacterised protein [Mycobacterium tuberculosis]|nr:Uncharacterised protein [Mycobacterium tuberculosis]
MLPKSSDPKPREGTETRGTVPPGPAPSGSSDPKPREGTETRKRSTSLTILFSRRQTQNPERGRKHFERELVHSPPFRSSDPKPREGTETPRGWRMRCARKCRQTQNPERGRKLNNTFFERGAVESVVRPKTPRGDGNPHGGTWTSATIGVVGPKTPRGDGNWTQNRTGCGRCSSRQTQTPERGRKRISPATPQPRYCSMSSDPNPREGTETHIPRHTTATLLLHVLRPKTPRGDGNWTQNRTGCGRCSGRQTQNPERGRKLVRHLCLIQVQCPVVRPKTPRGDGNAYPPPHHSHATAPCPQTQTPERGRKRISPATPQPRYCSMSSDPKPREGTETR